MGRYRVYARYCAARNATDEALRLARFASSDAADEADAQHNVPWGDVDHRHRDEARVAWTTVRQLAERERTALLQAQRTYACA